MQKPQGEVSPLPLWQHSLPRAPTFVLILSRVEEHSFYLNTVLALVARGSSGTAVVAVLS